MIERIKKAATFGAILAVAGVFALAAAFCGLFGLLSLVMDEPWAAALTALVFAGLFFGVAQTQKPPKKAARKAHDADAEGEHHGKLAGAAGVASHIPAQLMAVAKKHPAAAIGVGALAAVIVLRRPTLALMAATHLFGMGRPKSRWERARDWLPF